jgi:outer membrane biosynthesis protein TonB
LVAAPATAFGQARPPIGNPHSWITMNDYPAEARRARQEGRVRVRMMVGTTGRVET